MSNPSLRKQAVDLTEKIRTQISELNEDDPLHTWFTIELNTIGLQDTDAGLTLDEANARISALKQLQFLIFRQQMRLINPSLETLEEDHGASLLTAAAAMPSNVLESARDYRFSICPSLLHDPTEDNEQFDPVSPTAKIVGYLRGLDTSLNLVQSSDLKSEGEQLLNQVGISDPITQASMATLFQSRYRAINAAIASTSPTQVVEFASGISPRGLQWSRTSPGTIYVESDLPQLMIHKAKLIRNALMTQTHEAKGILHCRAVDVLDRNSVFDCLSTLDSEKSFCIVTEGLLLYFGEAEMKRFFAIISAALHEYPESVWVTDFVSKQNLQELFDSNPDVARGVRDVFSLTGRSVVPSNPFEDVSSVERWLMEFNLGVERQLPLAMTTQMLDLGTPLSQTNRDRMVGTRSIWCIRKLGIA